MLRALAVALPVRITASGGAAASRAASLLAGSPRFAPAPWGLELAVTETATGLGATLAGPDGAILRRVGVARGTDTTASARAICEAVHGKFFAPEIDLAQTDIASLEGSTLSGDEMREQVWELLGR